MTSSHPQMDSAAVLKAFLASHFAPCSPQLLGNTTQNKSSRDTRHHLGTFKLVLAINSILALLKISFVRNFNLQN
jgi:hypothetical protein